MLAGGIAVPTLISDNQLGKVVTYPTIVAAIVSIGLGLVLLFAYARQTNRYPWTGATKTWKWFYRDALPAEKNFNPTWWSFFWFGPEKRRLQSEYNGQLPRFKTKLYDLSDQAISLDQDIQQLYVLHINEKFKNIHLSQLRTIFQYGVFLLFSLSLIAAAWGAAVDRERVAMRHLSERTGGLKLDASWQFISPSDDNQSVLVSATIENSESTPADPPKWIFVNDHGSNIPATVTASTIEIEKISPGSRISYSLFVKPAERVPVESLTVRLK